MDDMVRIVGLAGLQHGKGRADQLVEDGHNDAQFTVTFGAEALREGLEAGATAHGCYGGEEEFAAKRRGLVSSFGGFAARGAALTLLRHDPQPSGD